MPGPLLPLALGALSAGSAWLTNRANADQAQKQMDFQERMSNTSAQRAVADYKAAGLNPALAYDKGASSPGGASAVIGDVAEKGINSAQSARLAMAQVRTAEANAQTAEAQAQLATAQKERIVKLTPEEVNQATADTTTKRVNALTAQEIFNAGPLRELDARIRGLNANTRATVARALLDEYAGPAAGARSDLWQIIRRAGATSARGWQMLGETGSSAADKIEDVIGEIISNAGGATAIIRGLRK